MKIAYLMSGRFPSKTADSIHIVKMCSAFASSGHDVTLVIPQRQAGDFGAESLFEFYGVPENFKVKRIDLGAQKISFWKSHRYSYKISDYAVSNDFDVIYTRDIYACYFTARIFRRPVYYEYHALFKTKSKSDTLLRSVLKSKNFRKLVVISQALKERYVSIYNISESLIYVAADGADPPDEDTVPARLTEKSAGRFHVGYIGHLYKGRGLELIGDMARSCPFAFFHIVGGNDEDIAYWKNRYSGIENIRFYGFVPPSQTAGFGKSMDILIAPYQRKLATAGIETGSTADWMSPLKIFEYMSLGKPIISSDMPALREVLTDKVNCVMCQPEDAGAWCGAIKKLYEDTALSEKIAAGALLSFKNYTWKKRAENIAGDVLIKERERENAGNLQSTPKITVFVRLLRFAALMFFSHLSRATVLFSTR